jgi:uncharacterized protein YegJ (DUF2314 family)
MTMKYISNIGFLFSIVSAASLVGCSKQDKVINVADNDPEMLAAIAKARDTLPRFWQIFDKREHSESDFCLKVKKGTEYFWLTEIQRKDGKTLGKVDNDPDTVGNVKLGERIVIPEDDISDWLYMLHGKMVGNYTLRVLFKQMPANEVEKCKKMLADP